MTVVVCSKNCTCKRHSWRKLKSPSQKPIEKLQHKDTIRIRLIELRGHRCENCGLEEWLGEPIMLEMHREIEGMPYSIIDNIKLLCPNCHSSTPNWRNKKQASLENRYIASA